MALDGIFLNLIRAEIEQTALDSRVEKIHQPSKDELLVHLRGRAGASRLLLSCRADAPRVHFTAYPPENPKSPPMFCMLLRKHLTGARLVAVRQIECERVLFFDFLATDDFGDKVNFTLVIEIMARHSNIILLNNEGTVVDSAKRVDFSKSSYRQVLPGLKYLPPPPQSKANVLTCDLSVLANAIVQSPKRLPKACQDEIMGVSPIVCREIASMVSSNDVFANECSAAAVESALKWLRQMAEATAKPCIINDQSGKPFDFTFFEAKQYGELAKSTLCSTYSELLDTYFYEKERIERSRRRSSDLFQQLNLILERTVRKIAAQEAQLKECENKEQLKIYGDLINSNLHNLQKGALFYDLQNFYDEALPMLRIPASPKLTPSQNAQKYYKDYRKLQTAEGMLTSFIESAQQDVAYIDSVLDLLTRATTDAEITQIKEELHQAGIIKLKQKNTKGRNKITKPKPLPPLEFKTDCGLTVLVGRNNIQNDKLTFKTARKHDIWFHAKDIAGSHTVLVTNGEEPSDCCILQAAQIAVYHSKGSQGANVAVDYAQVKNVKKPPGAKAGRVIYDNYKTLFVTPEWRCS